MEQDSAKQFYDVYLEQEMNLSEVSFIGSSNDINRVPPSILSRVKVIEVGYPPKDALQKMYASILSKALIEDYEIGCFTISVSDDITETQLANISPRQLRNNAGRILSQLIMKAAPGDHIHVSATDILGLDQFDCEKLKKGIGFLATLYVRLWTSSCPQLP